MADSSQLGNTAGIPLRLLLVEDSDPDSLIEEKMLNAAGFVTQVERVQTAEAMKAALSRQFDLIMADYSMPGFSGMDALALRNDISSDTPFVLVSGQISVETAVAVLKAGATDYVSKDELSRLGLVVKRALKEALDERERRRLQDQIILTQRMDAVGQLAGGVAHDYNNLLQVIVGYTEILMQRDGAVGLNELREIHSSALRAAELTRQLLSFSRRQMMVPMVLDVNAVLRDMQSIINPLLGESVALTMRLEPDLPLVFADSSHLEQAVVNLVMNGHDAMPEGGRLLIETASVVLDEEDVGRMMDARVGRFVRIRVTDSGCGITPDVMDHIFEPFYTTHGLGKRAGLGLSVTYGIVRQHNGWIHVRSQPGEGACFSLYLPIYEGKNMVQTAAIPEALPPRGAGERILLVEDEAAVREIAKRVLCSAGYEVVEAASVSDGLEAYNRCGGRFDVIFSDVVLPDGNGIDLVQKVLGQKPGTAVLLSSGYTDDRSRWKVIEERGYMFLPKPHSPSILLRAIHVALESTGKRSGARTVHERT